MIERKKKLQPIEGALRRIFILVCGRYDMHVSAESPLNISPNPSEVISKVSEPKDNF
jgi:hypothetical protein